ncbi:hypothetical protein [Acinetobacter bereziniae]|nr:hypothetical protein [Acinetobacter bereziniae]
MFLVVHNIDLNDAIFENLHHINKALLQPCILRKISICVSLINE